MTVDYDGEQAAPEPASQVIAQFLRRSFSIAEVLRGALRGWIFGVIGLAVGLIFGVYSIWVTPPTYTVSIGLLPTDAGGDVSIGDSGGALGALAGLIGMGGGPVPKFTRFVASLNATGVAQIMDKKYDMVCLTFGACDRKTHTWRKGTGFNAGLARLMAQIAHLPDPDAPRTALDLANNTASSVTMISDRTTHILTLSMDAPDPKFAVHYLNVLVEATNDFIREKDRSTILPYVDYLHRKLSTGLNLTQHDALSSLLLDQERRLMLSSVDVPYAASIQDGPNITMSNKAMRMLMVDAMLGLILGFGLGWIWGWTRSRRARSQSWTRY